MTVEGHLPTYASGQVVFNVWVNVDIQFEVIELNMQTRVLLRCATTNLAKYSVRCKLDGK